MTFVRDLAERAAKTALQAALAYWSVQATTLDVGSASAWKALVAGGIGAAVSAVTSWLSRLSGDPDTASLADNAGPVCPGATFDGWGD